MQALSAELIPHLILKQAVIKKQGGGGIIPQPPAGPFSPQHGHDLMDRKV